MATIQDHRPVATPMPPPPDTDSLLNAAQRTILFALFDGVLPSIKPSSSVVGQKDVEYDSSTLSDEDFAAAVDKVEQDEVQLKSREDIAAFLERRPSRDPKFQDFFFRTLALSPQKAQLAQVLSVLGTRLGSLLLTGHFATVDKQPIQVRETIVKGWTQSRLTSLRVLAKNITILAQMSDAVTSPLLQGISGFNDVPRDWKSVDGYDYKFIQVPKSISGSDKPHVLTTDVIIVGSGCGGAVAAKNLAEAGHSVMVVDKGYYFPPSHLPMPQDAGMSYLYDQAGVYMTETASMGLVSGGSWGGGGTVNWSVSLKLPDYVREEWSEDGKLPFFTSKQFDEACDRVSSFAGVGTENIRHNHRNRVLLDGSKRLGWKAKDAPQNTAGKEHYCGHCHLGCGSAEKRGPSVSWLPAAAEAGAKFMEGFQVDKVIFTNDGRTATGVEGVWTSRDAQGGVHKPVSEREQRPVIIKAKKVIMSAGSFWSPILLKRSGVENKQLGKNLHLHPCNFLSATYPEDTRPWEGGIITSYNSEFENLDEKGHGVKLEPTCMIPATILGMRPWTGGFNAKLTSLNYNHMASFISLCRDRDTGSVFEDPVTGIPRIDYDTSDFDAAHVMEGMKALSKICYVTGAKVIQPHLAGVEPFYPDQAKVAEANDSGKDPEFTDASFAEWLRHVQQVGNKPPVTSWVSAHQMGTCRMSSSRTGGVVDGTGKVWDKDNLYVADGSVFPSASGVNPMLTIFTVVDHISRCVNDDLNKW